ncbi:disease resistance At4g27190-like [Olea europaea subsp. europaea]|uniref:Disease resistance At4g27190-like n=1 Tax=Olea europaea subsp. europaea TaxID=158383 RepID=A0A8S0R6K7_OLEEU|nr:disease resistance At4g27190-like [Olea europaea subsp. europaea]
MKKAFEADKLKVEGTFERVSYPRLPVQVLNQIPRENFETRLSTKNKIKEALKDKDINIIGIYGMPGVDPNINKIQDQLAEMLDLKIEEKTNKDARAGRLHGRLKGNNGKSILVVLDDVWEKTDLGTIGIPSPHDCKGLKIMFTTRIEEMCNKMEAQKKFKIEVLDKKEGWQLFKYASGISDNETDDELVSIAKKVAYECRGLPIALMIVGKALKGNKTMYKWRDTLRKLQRSSATNLEEMDNIMYQSIRWSLNYLGSEDRDLLLLCSLFAKDESIPIENLVRYAKGLELYKGTETLCETRDKTKTIADNLKGHYLLQLGKKKNEVKLQDVIRDFCLQMAYEDERRYLVKHDGLLDWPEHDVDKSCSAISITFDKLGQLPDRLKYQNVKLLRVICRELGELIISEEFFKDMKELRVLELSGMYIQIPSSIELLTGLRTLSLIGCKIHFQLPMTLRLDKLEIFSFYQSFIGYSPIVFTNLGNLRSLDLRFHKFSRPYLLGVLSGMEKLEELYLGHNVRIFKNAVNKLDGNGFINLKTLNISNGDFEYLIDATTNSIPNGTFGKLESLELEYLPKLIEICNGNLSSVFKPLLFCNLMTVKMHFCKSITSLFHESVTKCLVNLQSLDIFECQMLEEVVSTDARGNEVTNFCKMLEFPKLKKVCLSFLSRFKGFTSQSNSDVVPQTLFNQVTLPNINHLHVNDLDCIVRLLGKEMPIMSLHKLTNMKVHNCVELLTIAESDSIQLLQNLEDLEMVGCNALEVLFDFEVNSLVALENLSIDSCKALEEIIGQEEEEENTSETRNIVMDANTPSNLHRFTQVSMDAKRNEVINMLQVPKLNSLLLRNLSSFKSFRSGSNNDGILRMLFNQVTLPNMKKLYISGLQYITRLVDMLVENSSESLQNLEILEVKYCKALEVLFVFETIPEDHVESVFGQLRSVKLEYLDNLVHIIETVPNGIRGFENLTSIVVERCGILKYLFLPSMAHSLVSLEVLEVSDCESIEVIVRKEEEEEGTSEIKIIEGVETIMAFPNLNRLLLKNLSSIQMFCSQNCELVLPLLKDLTIENCPMMTKLSPRPVIAPKLDISDLLDKAGGLAEEDQVCNK